MGLQEKEEREVETSSWVRDHAQQKRLDKKNAMVVASQLRVHLHKLCSKGVFQKLRAVGGRGNIERKWAQLLETGRFCHLDLKPKAIASDDLQ